LPTNPGKVSAVAITARTDLNGATERCVRQNYCRRFIWVCTPVAPTRLVLARTALRGLTGRATDRDLHAFETVEFRVQARTPRINSMEGEVSVMQAPLYYRIHPPQRNLRKVSIG
jgi:hypothetical protein